MPKGPSRQTVLLAVVLSLLIALPLCTRVARDAYAASQGRGRGGLHYPIDEGHLPGGYAYVNRTYAQQYVLIYPGTFPTSNARTVTIPQWAAKMGASATAVQTKGLDAGVWMRSGWPLPILENSRFFQVRAGPQLPNIQGPLVVLWPNAALLALSIWGASFLLAWSVLQTVRFVWRWRTRPMEQRCVKCGYALVGLPAARPCPECGEFQSVADPRLK